MLKNIFKKNSSSVKGASLLELILYITIVGGLAGTVSLLFISFSNNKIKAESQSELSQNARIAIEKIRQEVVIAGSVDSPVSGASSNTLNLIMSTNWTCFQVVTLIGVNILQMSEDGVGACGVAWKNITSNKVSVDTTSSIFKNITNNNANPTVQVKLKLIYVNHPDFIYSTQTTVSIR